MQRRSFIALVTLLFCLPSLAYAGGRIVYRLAVDPPPEVAALDREGQREFARKVISSLTARLEAAGVKEHEVRMATSSTYLVDTGWDHDRAWMEALLTSPGRVELRPVVEGKPDWMSLVRELPPGVELRGGTPPYAWSARRSLLEPFLERLQIAGVRLYVFPEPDGGFRTISAADPVGTRGDLVSSTTRQTSTGAAFAELQFGSSVAARLAAAGVSEVEKVAVVLDGQVIGFVRAGTLRSQSPVRISPPEGALPDDRDARRMWVRQVVGRLVAPLPIPIAVLKE